MANTVSFNKSAYMQNGGSNAQQAYAEKQAYPSYFANTNNKLNQFLLGKNYDASQETAPKMNTSMNQQTFGSDLQKKSNNYDTYFAPGYEDKVGNITYNNGQQDVTMQKVTGAIPGMKIEPNTPTASQNYLNDLVYKDYNPFVDDAALLNSITGGGARGYAVNFDKDGFISNYGGALRDAADQEYEATTNAAYTTQQDSLADLRRTYNEASSSIDENRQDAKSNYLKSIANTNQNAYNALSQQNELQAARGLSNSGLSSALSQAQYAALNTNLANIDQQFNETIQKLGRDLTKAINEFGIGRETANKIYNRNLESAEKIRQSQYHQAIQEATAKGMEHQLTADSQTAANFTNASIANANNATQVSIAKANLAASLKSEMSDKNYKQLQIQIAKMNLSDADEIRANKMILSYMNGGMTIQQVADALDKMKTGTGNKSKDINSYLE